MSVEADIRTHLLATAGVTALVSTRIYQLILPQHPTLPAIRLQVLDEREPSLLAAQGGLFWTRIQCDAYDDAVSGSPYSSVTAIGEAIHAAMAAAVITDLGSPASIRIRGIHLLDRSTSYEADELRLVRERRDYSVQYAHLS